MNNLEPILLKIFVDTKPNMPEDEVEHLLNPLYAELGYEQTGRDIRRKKRGRSGIPDVLLLNSDDSIQVVVEVKRPSEILTEHENQVKRYMTELKAPYGILTNGTGFRFYKRDNLSIDCILAQSTNTLASSANIFEPLQKKTLELTDYQAIKSSIQAIDALTLHRVGELASNEFLHIFSLEAGSPFTELVSATLELLNLLKEQSGFVSGSYEFWSKIYARKLEAGDAPTLWKNSGIVFPNTEEGLKRFSFSLETAYTLIARLMLAKAIEDHDPQGKIVENDDHLGKRLLTQLEARKSGRRGQYKLPPTAYLEGIESLFNTYALNLFTSIYATDIFDWWRDYTLQPDSPAVEGFSRAVGRTLLALLRFNFSELQGDLLGELYQHYFDPETRKALGEFYTPPAVVEFILDEVGYTGGRAMRLLDPATGSGTFIVQALRRYLKANAAADPVQTLEGITQEYRLVAFDVNPFAVLMAQINFAAELIPLYGKAIERNPDFILRRLPIVRTDSLRQEHLEGEALDNRGILGFIIGADTIIVSIRLPIKLSKDKFKEVPIEFPKLEHAKTKQWVSNEAEWLDILQVIFASVERLSQAYDKKQTLELSTALRSEISRVTKNPNVLLVALTPYVEKLWTVLKGLKDEHGDGRFLKTLEDLALGMVLKHYLSYDYVVGNPPYVRVQNLPDESTSDWKTSYNWAEGNYDIYMPFIERALKTSKPWLKPEGRLGYIIPNRFLSANYGATLRQELPNVARVISITDFTAVTFQPEHDTSGSRLFREAMVYPAILIAEKVNQSSSEPITITRFYPKKFALEPEAALTAVKLAYTTLRAGKTPPTLEYAQIFSETHTNLKSSGWNLMPTAERHVFDKLEQIGNQIDPILKKTDPLMRTRRLQNYTSTQSGGFAGIQTSADETMILKQIEEDTEQGLLWVQAKGGGEPFWVEKAALRKFLFGKDVARWGVQWDEWWVIFPYFEHLGRYILIPSSDYQEWERINKRGGRETVFAPFKRYPDNTPVLDTLYPRLWAYLEGKEVELRKRENGRYKRERNDEYRWYDLARPQSLDCFERPKIVLQVSSNSAKYTHDFEGYFFTAGGTSGVYGIMPEINISPLFLSSVLNSNVLDFYLKSISSIFSGGYYSYGDQFIKDLPIPPVTLEQETTLSSLAEQLSINARENYRLEQCLKQFPDSYTTELRMAGNMPDLDTLERIAPVSGNLSQKLEYGKAELKNTLTGEIELKIGRASLHVGGENLADLVLKTLEGQKTIARQIFLDLKFPTRARDQQKYLEIYKKWEAEIIRLELEAKALQAELELKVYEVFQLNQEDIEVIQNFLEHF